MVFVACRASVLVALIQCIALLAGGSSALAAPVFYGPTHYASSADSPFDLSQLGVNFWLENFEDNLLNTPGVTSFNGAPRGPSSLTDSVGRRRWWFDGHGNNGHSYLVRPGITGVTFQFNPDVLGDTRRMSG